MQKLIAAISLLVLLSSCWDFLRRPPVNNWTKVWGYKPVYSNDSSLLTVRASGPQPVLYPGKIYVKGNLIYQNEFGAGIHVINKTDPSNPVRIGFIHVRGNSEISIKGNHLYANSFSDLLVIDISDWQQVAEIKRIPNAFTAGSYAYSYNFIPLPEHKVYYECPNPFSGIQTGWIRDSVFTYSCYYN